jgi:phenylacetic acid degradation protein
VPRVYSVDGITPVVMPGAYVHPSAVLIGDVIVASRAYIGPCACLRGDFGRIVVEEGANIQDSCLLHGFPGKDTVVGAEATVGHGAVLHGCVLGRGALRWKKDNMLLYQDLARRSAASMRETEALTAVEPQRKRIDIPGAVPLSELKAANR